MEFRMILHLRRMAVFLQQAMDSNLKLLKLFRAKLYFPISSSVDEMPVGKRVSCTPFMQIYVGFKKYMRKLVC